MGSAPTRTVESCLPLRRSRLVIDSVDPWAAPIVHYGVSALDVRIYRSTTPVPCPLLRHTLWP